MLMADAQGTLSHTAIQLWTVFPAIFTITCSVRGVYFNLVQWLFSHTSITANHILKG